ncbi:hypothetical protein ARMSODRAFT_209708 [Armillaria solidipes]|uniref:Uncharacterized protein n=1 Tax=Armillaria solidipes TaxID=1076256 RepID=A0A2H3BBD3_9AGAR|nr:hypothetical protein ARMSODRAFT_209708 [Armillaria solidipes]
MKTQFFFLILYLFSALGVMEHVLIMAHIRRVPLEVRRLGHYLIPNFSAEPICVDFSAYMRSYTHRYGVYQNHQTSFR